MYPHTPHVCLNTVATLGPQTREPAPSGPAPRLLLAGPTSCMLRAKDRELQGRAPPSQPGAVGGSSGSGGSQGLNILVPPSRL